MNPKSRMDITQRIAEGVALLLGANSARRLQIRDVLIYVYGSRSKAVHGAEHHIMVSDVRELRDIAYVLIQRLMRWADRFKKVTELEDWLSDSRMMAHLTDPPVRE